MVIAVMLAPKGKAGKNRGIIMQRTNMRKFKELVLYVSQKSANDPKFGSTKLNKLVLFSDMLHFANTGKSITGAKYMKQNNGPVATCMKPALEEMKDAGEMVMRPEPTAVGVEKVPVAMRLPELSQFGGDEIATVDEVISDFKRTSNSRISDFSHEFIPNWEQIPSGQTIPLGAILYPAEVVLTDDDKTFFKDLLTETEWGRQLLHERRGATA